MRRLALMLVLAAGCASQKNAREALENSIEAYNEAFRWKNYERASAFVPADLRTAFVATYEDDKNELTIDDYSIVKVDLENENSATVTVRVRYTQLPSVTVEKTTLVQHWKQIGGAWILETEDNALRVVSPSPSPSPETEEPSSEATFGNSEP